RHQHAPLGVQDLQRAHRGARRRAGHTSDVWLDVLQPVGEVGPVERRRPWRGGAEPAVADPDAASPCIRVRLGERQRRPASGAGSSGVPPHCVRVTLVERPGRHRLFVCEGSGRRSPVGRDSHGRAVQLAASCVLVRREISRHARVMRGAGRQRTHSHLGEPQKVHPRRQALADQRYLVHARWSVGREFHARQYSTGTAAALRPFQQRGGLRAESAACPLREHPRSVRGLCRDRVANRKMTMYWMLNSHWPSFYGNIIDYYLSPGGAYYGAKKGLRPLSVVFASYGTGDRTQARIIIFNQTPDEVRGLRVRTRVYDLDGKVRDD